MRRLSIVCLLVTATLGAAFAPSALAAATVSVSGDTLTITGTEGDDSMRVRVTNERTNGAPEYFVGDFPGITAGAGCLQQGEDVYCANPLSLTKVDVNLGGGDDLLVSSQCIGGFEKNDDTWNVQAGAGNDDVDMFGPEHQGAPDIYNGGPGLDIVNYSHRAEAMTINLATGTVTHTGNFDGTDMIPNVEHATGGLGADTITGSDGPNRIRGGVFRGPSQLCNRDMAVDTINAGDGPDVIVGAGGNDVINGEGGTDMIAYFERSGTNNGGPVTINLAAQTGGAAGENDQLTSIEDAEGSPNAGDVITGSDVANFIYTDEDAGQDTVTCGGAADIVVADDDDSVDAPSCETIQRPGDTPVDTDGDSVPNSTDLCADQAGPASNDGCPVSATDADGDGVPDDTDVCDSQPGPANNNGCPLPPADTDGDGVPDSSDQCINQAGPASNNGCPQSPNPPPTTPSTPSTTPSTPSTPTGNTPVTVPLSPTTGPTPPISVKIAQLIKQLTPTQRGTVPIVFTFPMPGRLTITGVANLPPRTIRAAAATRAVSIDKSVPAGRHTVVIRLKGKAQRALRKAKRLKVKLTITYTPAGGAASTTARTVTLKV